MRSSGSTTTRSPSRTPERLPYCRHGRAERTPSSRRATGWQHCPGGPRAARRVDQRNLTDNRNRKSNRRYFGRKAGFRPVDARCTRVRRLAQLQMRPQGVRAHRPHDVSDGRWAPLCYALVEKRQHIPLPAAQLPGPAARGARYTYVYRHTIADFCSVITLPPSDIGYRPDGRRAVQMSSSRSP
jgi:hypothetical protein